MTKITTMYFNKNNFTPINLKFYDMVNPVFSTFDNFQTMLPTDLIQFQEINFSPLIQRKIATKNQNSKDFFKEMKVSIII